jgi:hypothetical protein
VRNERSGPLLESLKQWLSLIFHIAVENTFEQENAGHNSD